MLIDFIITKLEDKAQEAVPEEPESIQQIIDCLKGGIKHKPSEEIESAILALRMENLSLTKFAKKAEDLATELRRSLRGEGFTEEKAKELAIKRTKEMCRKQTKISYVKSVLQSTVYDTPSEVVSALIIEMKNAKDDKHDTEENKTSNKFNNNRGNHRGRGRGGYNSHRNGNGNGNNFNRNYNNNQNNGNNFHRNNNNNNNRGGYRGRGRGGYNSNGHNNRNEGQNMETFMRYIQGNWQVPPNGGQPQAQPQQNQQMLPRQ